MGFFSKLKKLRLKDIGTGKKYPTKIFNGYEKWVSYLYKGIDSNSLFF